MLQVHYVFVITVTGAITAGCDTLFLAPLPQEASLTHFQTRTDRDRFEWQKGLKFGIPGHRESWGIALVTCDRNFARRRSSEIDADRAWAGLSVKARLLIQVVD